MASSPSPTPKPPGAGVLCFTADMQSVWLGRPHKSGGHQKATPAELEEFGGRWDKGDRDTFDTAMREALEETKGALRPVLEGLTPDRGDPRLKEIVSIQGYVCYFVTVPNDFDLAAQFAAVAATTKCEAELDSVHRVPVRNVVGRDPVTPLRHRLKRIFAASTTIAAMSARAHRDSTGAAQTQRRADVAPPRGSTFLTGTAAAAPEATHRPQPPRAACHYFATAKGCARGDTCPFGHLAEGPATTPPDAPSPVRRLAPSAGVASHAGIEVAAGDGRKLCRHFATAEGCRNGAQCKFRHSDARPAAHAPQQRPSGGRTVVLRRGAGILLLTHDQTAVILGVDANRRHQDFGGYEDEADAGDLFTTALRETVEETRGAVLAAFGFRGPGDGALAGAREAIQSRVIELVRLDAGYDCFIVALPPTIMAAGAAPAEELFVQAFSSRRPRGRCQMEMEGVAIVPADTLWRGSARVAAGVKATSADRAIPVRERLAKIVTQSATLGATFA